MSYLLFRVESKTEKSESTDVFNKGFYRINSENGVRLSELASMDSNNDPRHPLPTEDSKLEDFWYSILNSEQYYFGFSSFDQLKRWFYKDEYLTKIESYVMISVYEVSRLKIGYTQAICNYKDVITRLHTFPITVKESQVIKELEFFTNNNSTTNKTS